MRDALLTFQSGVNFAVCGRDLFPNSCEILVPSSSMTLLTADFEKMLEPHFQWFPGNDTH